MSSIYCVHGSRLASGQVPDLRRDRLDPGCKIPGQARNDHCQSQAQNDSTESHAGLYNSVNVYSNENCNEYTEYLIPA